MFNWQWMNEVLAQTHLVFLHLNSYDPLPYYMPLLLLLCYKDRSSLNNLRIPSLLALRSLNLCMTVQSIALCFMFLFFWFVLYLDYYILTK